MDSMEFESLKGKTLKSVIGIVGGDDIDFETTGGERYRLVHHQYCCESVTVEDICGDLQDLVGSPILIAEEAISDEHPEDHEAEEYEESFTWTFYRLSTIRFYGSSNGYYSESVDFERVD